MEPMGQTPAIRTPATTDRRLVALRTAETTSALRYEAVSPRPAETAACDRGAGVAGSSDSTRSTAEHLTAARLRHGRTLREVSRQGHVGVRRRRAPPRPLHPEAPGGARSVALSWNGSKSRVSRPQGNRTSEQSEEPSEIVIIP